MSFRKRLITRIRSFFIRSNHVHLRQEPVPNTRDLVALMDRWLDGPLRYDMEWDDFISWESANLHVERIREAIGEFENFLFSGDPEDRNVYVAKVIEERNKLAALLNIPLR